MGITYLVGDATAPSGDGPKIIAHICNDRGAWGAGFVLALSRRWSEPENAYRGQAVGGFGVRLCDVQFVTVTHDKIVANMVAQTLGYGREGEPPIQYDALANCLYQVAMLAKRHNATVHMPRIGCGLAGGIWEVVESIIESELCEQGVQVFVYDLPK